MVFRLIPMYLLYLITIFCSNCTSTQPFAFGLQSSAALVHSTRERARLRASLEVVWASDLGHGTQLRDLGNVANIQHPPIKFLPMVNGRRWKFHFHSIKPYLPMTTLNQASPICRTAFDALQAKQSALDAGYQPLVVHNDRVYRKLQQATGSFTGRRQTPLVNAGYAARVMAMSHSIYSFCNYHQFASADKEIQIVLMGCGVDIIGLWSQSLFPNQRIRVVEVDLPEVCTAKRDFLIRENLVEIKGEPSERGVLAGKSSSAQNANYYLCPGDLGEVDKLEWIIGDLLDASVPTLIVSELVLAYLSSDKTDKLLNWCHSKLLLHPESAIVLLEPLGCQISESDTFLSVAKGYRRDYNDQFAKKMERGKSLNQHTSSATDKEIAPFYPIGTSLQDVERRFRFSGFPLAFASSVGSAAADSMAGDLFRIPEVFDEHAALVLHLDSYTLATAFTSSKTRILARCMCPSKFSASEIPPEINSDIIFTPAEKVTEEAVRHLFYDTYAGHFEKYPAIRKMMSGVMKGEFTLSSADSVEPGILTSYKKENGCFFVALVRSDDFEETCSLKPVGCIGIRNCEKKDEEGTMEFFRLAVDETQRGKGLGRRLLQLAEDFALSRGAPKLIASTLTILDKAQRLYETSGYTHMGDTPAGALTFRHYAKRMKN